MKMVCRHTTLFVYKVLMTGLFSATVCVKYIAT